MIHWPAFIKSKIALYAREPWTMVRQLFKVEPDIWQDEALHAIAKPETERLAMKACKGPGKTAVLAWIILWFLLTRHSPRIGATSITEGNIDANLWPELYTWMSKSQVFTELFVHTKTRVFLKQQPADWYCDKRTWPKHGNQQQQMDALAGLHAPHVMFVLDEAGGIPQAVMVTVEAVLANVDSEGKVVIAGNPTHTTGPLYRACTTDRKLWYVITITGDPDSPKRSPRIKLEWARNMIKQYGRDNPWVLVNVFGEFPPESINALLGAEEVEGAMHRSYAPDIYQWAQKRIGVDVARFGDDRTVLFPRQGLQSFKPIIMRNVRTTHIAARVARGISLWTNGTDEILTFVDDTFQWGKGVIDQLIAGGYPVIPVVYHAPAVDPRYKNRRSHNWMKGAEWVKAGGALPFIPELIPELTEITYSFLGGQFVLEPKELLKERIGVSPDIADALFQTFDMDELPNQVIEKLRGGQRVRHDGDPYQLGGDPTEGTGLVSHDGDPLS